jgi:hypothetical protein
MRHRTLTEQRQRGIEIEAEGAVERDQLADEDRGPRQPSGDGFDEDQGHASASDHSGVGTFCLMSVWLARRVRTAADSEKTSLNRRFFTCGGGKRLYPKLGGRQAGLDLEGAIEGAERLESGIQRNGRDGHLPLAWIRQSLFGIGESPLIEIGAEVAMTELLVEQAAQFVFGDAGLSARALIVRASPRYARSTRMRRSSFCVTLTSSPEIARADSGRGIIEGDPAIGAKSSGSA